MSGAVGGGRAFVARARYRLLARAGAWLPFLACSLGDGAAEREPLAQFGVFYGDQVQRLQSIPLELDRSRQRHGFRLEMWPAPAHSIEVRWEIGLPGQGPRRTDALGRRRQRRRTRLGVDRWRAGERRFERALAFSPNDVPGLWNVRVEVADRVVLDRAFSVHAKRGGGRSVRSAIQLDAGF